MGRQLTGRKPGPQISIDWDEVDKDLLAGLPGTKIAESLGIHEDTLYRRCEQEHGMGFAAYARSKHSFGEKMLARRQYERAVGAGNIQMLIHLGKHRLGQVDKPSSVNVVNQIPSDIFNTSKDIVVQENIPAPPTDYIAQDINIDE